MSLDVYLTIPIPVEEQEPRRCEHCGSVLSPITTRTVFETNITHNLNRMAKAAGVYEACWRPHEIGATKAKDIIALLRNGLTLLRSDEKRFRQYDASNGWGRYEHFVPWLSEVLIACEEYPEAEITVSR